MQKPLIFVLGTVTALSCSSFITKDKSEPKTKANSKFVQGQRVNITNLYNDTCSKCHGVNGEGGGGGTPSLLNWKKFDQSLDKPFFDATKHGVPAMGMEGYGETMSDQVIWGLVVHIRELQWKHLRAENKPVEKNGVFSSKYASYQIENVLEKVPGLATPWSIDWLPGGKMLVTSRSGKMAVVTKGQVEAWVEGLPASTEIGQGGLMEVAVEPNYATTGWIYLSVADPSKDGGRKAMTKIVRGKLSISGGQAKWTDTQTIFEVGQDAYNGSGVHFGSKIVFDNKGKLFFSIGDRGSQDRAQQLDKPNGKIFRVNMDGSIPADNPFAKSPTDAIKAIWSYGHRNPQGLAMLPNGELWDTEHAPRGGDELNQVEKARNYGWPVVSFGINYNDSAFATPWGDPKLNIKMPAFRWLPSIGASGLDHMRGSAFPQWKGDLIAGGLSGANVDRIRVKNGQMVEREELMFGRGRVRDIAVGPDGFIYVALNGPDKIVRLVPAR
jgi:aldose sugar dehydrogenase